METTELQAGREMDTRIHYHVFNRPCMRVEEVVTIFTVDRQFLDVGDYYSSTEAGFERVPPYSTEIGAAWRVVEHLTARGLENFPRGLFFELDGAALDRSWRAAFSCRKYETAVFEGHGETPAEAVCRAALQALRPPAGG